MQKQITKPLRNSLKLEIKNPKDGYIDSIFFSKKLNSKISFLSICNLNNYLISNSLNVKPKTLSYDFFPNQGNE